MMVVLVGEIHFLMGRLSMTTPVVEFNPVSFCESLFTEACAIAKNRLGQEPMPHQLQMVDLLTAFRGLRQIDYSNHFGLLAGEWNEGMAIVKTYIASANPKAVRTLHPELGMTIGTIIEGWRDFQKLPKDVQTNLRKAKQQYAKTEDKFAERLYHFFSEMKVRASSLEPPEKEGVFGLISLYQPQARTACHRGEVDTAIHHLSQLEMDLKRLSIQSKTPSRGIETLVIKTRHDLAELESFGNKGKKGRKKVAVK